MPFFWEGGGNSLKKCMHFVNILKAVSLPQHRIALSGLHKSKWRKE